MRYLRGEGIDRNVDKAIVLFQRSCDRGLQDACENLRRQETADSRAERSDESADSDDGGASAPRTGRVKVTFVLATPGAQVTLEQGDDARQLATFPITVRFPPSSWSVHAKKKGYCDLVRDLDLTQGSMRRVVAIELQPGCP
jgi:hypothetical protein